MLYRNFQLEIYHIQTNSKYIDSLRKIVLVWEKISQSPRGVPPEEAVLRMSCKCMDVISINLKYSFVKIALLHGCSTVGLLHVSRASFWRTPLEDCL